MADKYCVMCDILDFEIRENKRKIFENNDFLIIEPFASRNPFGTWVVPWVINSTVVYSLDNSKGAGYPVKRYSPLFSNEAKREQHNFVLII